MKKIKQFTSILLVSIVLMFSFVVGTSKVNAANNLTFDQIQSIRIAIQSILLQIQALTLQLNQLTQQSDQGSQYDQFSGWKTCKNDYAGFEMKYPADFSLVENDSKSVLLKKDNSEMQVIFNPVVTGGGCGEADDYTFMTFFEIKDMQRFEKTITINNQPLKILYNVLNPGYCNDKLANMGISKCITDTRVSAYVVPKSAKSTICSDFSFNGMKYGINFGGKFNVNSNEATAIFEKMLSTIKFTTPQSVIAAKQNPYIEVLQPAGQLKEGNGYLDSTYSISWNQAGLGDKSVNIYLDAFNRSGQAIEPKPEYTFIDGSNIHSYLVAKSVPVSHQLFNWKIPAGLSERFESAPDKYKIRVASAPTLSSWGVKPEKLPYNQSKDYFTILK